MCPPNLIKLPIELLIISLVNKILLVIVKVENFINKYFYIALYKRKELIFKFTIQKFAATYISEREIY